MKPERQFWVWMALLSLGAVALVAAQVVALRVLHAEELDQLRPAVQISLLVFLVIDVLSLLPLLMWGMHSWFRRYVLPVHRLSEGVEALLFGSHRARLEVGEDDPTGLESKLNALMERYQTGEEQVQARLDAALGELSAEHSRLESLLGALSEGVVMCDLEGRVLLANPAARRLFAERGDLMPGKALPEFIGPAVLEFAHERLQVALGSGARHPVVRFECYPMQRHPTAGAAGAGLPARISPLLVLGGRLEGLVLTVQPGDEHGELVTLPGHLVQPPLSRAPDWQAAPLSSLRYVVFDTETTGLNPAEGHEVISLAAVAVSHGRREPAEFDVLVNPGRPVSRSAQRVHGIDDAQLEGRPTLVDVLPNFERFAAHSVLVAHFAAFDMAFLRPSAAEAGVSLNHPLLDTMVLSALLHPHQNSHALDSLIQRYGVAPEQRHSALGDARMTAEVLLRLLPQLESRGIVTLGEALRACRASPLAHLNHR